MALAIYVGPVVECQWHDKKRYQDRYISRLHLFLSEVAIRSWKLIRYLDVLCYGSGWYAVIIQLAVDVDALRQENRIATLSVFATNFVMPAHLIVSVFSPFTEP